MSSESKPTEGPWHVMERGPFRGGKVPTVYATDDELRYVAFCADPNELNRVATNNLANAQFIARACNSHAQLLAACEAAVKEYTNVVVQDQLRSAIAAAKGGAE